MYRTKLVTAVALCILSTRGLHAQSADAQSQSDQTLAMRYKGVKIVPGGFLAGESVWRQRAMNADILDSLASRLTGGEGTR